MALPTEPVCRYFTESCQTITTYAIITDENIPSVFTITITDGIYLSVFDRVLKHLLPCHYYRQNISVGDYRRKYRRIDFVGNIPAGICRASLSIRLSVFRWWLFFFIFDIISDGMRNYRWLVYRRTDFVGETVGDNFTDGCHGLHRWN